MHADRVLEMAEAHMDELEEQLERQDMDKNELDRLAAAEEPDEHLPVPDELLDDLLKDEYEEGLERQREDRLLWCEDTEGGDG